MAGGEAILIVGAGPVGLTAALELARRGYRPRIIDKGAEPTPPEQSRALAINLRTLQLLGPSGASRMILGAAHQISEFRMQTGRRRLMTIDALEELPDIPSELPASCRGLYALPQGETERILIAQLGKYAIVPEWNTECIGLAVAGHRQEVNVVLPDGVHKTFRTALVIGADGAHSAVRKLAGFAFPGKPIDAEFHLADYSYSEPFDASYVEARFYDPGVIARIPISAGALRYVSTLADFRNRIEHPATIGKLLWQAEFRVSFRHVGTMSRGRVFLAGDAAHIHSPIGGRGMNLGIEDACWLAWLISEGREADYASLRMPEVRRVLADTFRSTRLVLMRDSIAIAARDALVPIVSRMRPIRRRGLRNLLGLDTKSPPWLAAS